MVEWGIVPHMPTAMTRRGPIVHPWDCATVGSRRITLATGCARSHGPYFWCFLSTDSAMLASSGTVNSTGVTTRLWWSRWYRSGRRRLWSTVLGSGDWFGGDRVAPCQRQQYRAHGRARSYTHGSVVFAFSPLLSSAQRRPSQLAAKLLIF